MRYKVTLTAHGNIDHNQNPYEMIVPMEVAKCDTIEECQKVVRDFIEENNLGGGNFTGGQVYEGNVKVGYISYNGRFWENE